MPISYDLNAGELPALETITDKMLRRGMRKAIVVLRNAVREEAPKRTGKLAGSVRSTVAGDGRVAAVLIGNRRKNGPWYGHIVNEGAKPHRIPKTQRRVRVRDAKGKGHYAYLQQPGYLAKIGGRLVYVKAFMHPGTPPNSFMERAAGRTVGEIERIIAETVGPVVAGL